MVLLLAVFGVAVPLGLLAWANQNAARLRRLTALIENQTEVDEEESPIPPWARGPLFYLWQPWYMGRKLWAMWKESA